MPRRKAAPRREILPDPLFHSILLAKFINTVMRNGKKSIAEKVVYGALDQVVKSVGHIGGEGEGDGGEQVAVKAAVAAVENWQAAPIFAIAKKPERQL